MRDSLKRLRALVYEKIREARSELNQNYCITIGHLENFSSYDIETIVRELTNSRYNVIVYDWKMDIYWS